MPVSTHATMPPEAKRTTAPWLDDKLAEKLQRCPNLPSPPHVAERIIALAQDPAANIKSVANVVSLDPALTAKILRTARSALYARRRKAENLRQAIALFGLNGTLNLALSFSLVSTLRAEGHPGMDYGLFWRRSVAAATCSQVLGGGLGAKEDLFLGALLQDIGMLALDKAAPDLYQEVGPRQADHRHVVNVERATLGVDHAAVGAWLLQRWNLPERYVHAVAWSHDLSELKVDARRDGLRCCVAVTGTIADILFRDDHEQATEDACQLAQSLLGVDREALVPVLDAMNAALQDTAALFEVDLGDPGLAESILSQAKDVLLFRSLQAIQETHEIKTTAVSLQTRTRELEEAARRDNLTGLHNRAHLDEVARKEFDSARQKGGPLAIAFLDLDHFKQINDTYGHTTGDQVLKSVASLLSSQAREADVVARYGGEEFVVLLPGTGLTGAQHACERFIRTIQTTKHDIGEATLAVTVSVGVAVHGEELEFDRLADLLEAADQALYTAKQQGRNRFVLYSAQTG